MINLLLHHFLLVSVLIHGHQQENVLTGGLGALGFRVIRATLTLRYKEKLLPDDDIHDQEVSHQADDTDNHVDDHDGDLHPRWQQGIGLIVAIAEVVVEERVVVKLGQQEVIRELHLWDDTVLQPPERRQVSA